MSKAEGLTLRLPQPGLPRFDYLRAESPSQVLEVLHAQPDEVLLFMGGTDVLIQMRDGEISPELLLDIKHLPGMITIAYDKKGMLSLGAGTTMNQIVEHPDVVQHFPLLAEAAASVASYQLRNRATIGGNLCNASPSADTAPVTLVLEATLVAVGEGGERRIPSKEFFEGPGVNTLLPGEFLARIEFPNPPEGWRGRYIKLGRNARGDLAIASVAVIGYPEREHASGFGFRIALGSVAPTPIRGPRAEDILTENTISTETLEQAAEAAQQASAPIDDIRASARYRKEMVKVITLRALEEVWSALKEVD
jgi:carbon-monoxide dehydrogenase medium subunit